MELQPQLEQIGLELAEARRRAHEIATPLTAELWSTRPAVAQWSVAGCLIHLNLTSRAFLPLIRDAIRTGRDLKLLGTGPYRRDVVGWFVYWITAEKILDAFDRLQEQLAGCLRPVGGGARSARDENRTRSSRRE
jgi:hypothetical protein